MPNEGLLHYNETLTLSLSDRVDGGSVRASTPMTVSWPLLLSFFFFKNVRVESTRAELILLLARSLTGHRKESHKFKPASSTSLSRLEVDIKAVIGGDSGNGAPYTIRTRRALTLLYARAHATAAGPRSQFGQGEHMFTSFSGFHDLRGTQATLLRSRSTLTGHSNLPQLDALHEIGA